VHQRAILLASTANSVERVFVQNGRKTVERPETVASSPKRRRSWIWLSGSLLLVALLVWGSWYYFYRRQIDASGGFYSFTTFALNVPRFAQDDPRWNEELLGSGPTTVGEEGCAVSSAAMVLAFYGVDVDPGRLNRFLQTQGGYTEQGWLYWEKAAEFPPGKAVKKYEDVPSYFLIDSNLLSGNPVIVRIRLASSATHFVVIVGKRGFNYLIQDPASGGTGGIYPLRRLTKRIEALRFYERRS
jgi:Peptidase_C39 like family